jgi:2,4'-dihydroxyacetophenone dioxygenase
MMNVEKITTSYVDAQSYPWIPFTPYSNEVFIKVLKIEPVSGTFVTLLKAPATMRLPKHHHCGTVMVYTIKGTWKYIEHDWTATPGSFVYETAASVHTPIAVAGDEIITLNIQVGDSLYLDDKDNIIAVENWKSVMKRHVEFHKARGTVAPDLTDFTE